MTSGRWITYYAVQTYDLFNYYISLAFNPRLYQPREWNWLSLPFMAAAVLAAIGGHISRHSRRYTGIFRVLTAVLILYVSANILLLMPYGGIRNAIFLAPLIWLGYGEVVYRLSCLRLGRRGRVVLLGVAAVLLPLLPFLFSLPGFYRDRVSRVDLDKLGSLIEKYRPDLLIMPEATYYPYRMLLQRHPGFEEKYIKPLGVTVTSFFEFLKPIPQGSPVAGSWPLIFSSPPTADMKAPALPVTRCL